MASKVFPKAQLGSFTYSGLGDLSYQRPVLESVQLVSDITASGDTAPVFFHGLPIVGCVVSAFIKNDTGGAIGSAQSSSFAAPGLDMKVADWNTRKFWQLVDVTGSGDSEKNWSWEIPIVGVAARGWVEAHSGTGPEYDTQSATITMNLSQFGGLTGTGKYHLVSVAGSHKRGGPFGVAYQATYSGTVTYTPATNINFKFASTDVDPPSGTVTWDLGSAETISHKALAYMLDFRNPSRTGEEIRVILGLRFDEA